MLCSVKGHVLYHVMLHSMSNVFFFCYDLSYVMSNVTYNIKCYFMACHCYNKEKVICESGGWVVLGGWVWVGGCFCLT